MWPSQTHVNPTHVVQVPGAMLTMLAMQFVLVNLVLFPNLTPSQVKSCYKVISNVEILDLYQDVDLSVSETQIVNRVTFVRVRDVLSSQIHVTPTRVDQVLSVQSLALAMPSADVSLV